MSYLSQNGGWFGVKSESILVSQMSPLPARRSKQQATSNKQQTCLLSKSAKTTQEVDKNHQQFATANKQATTNQQLATIENKRQEPASRQPPRAHAQSMQVGKRITLTRGGSV